MVLMLIYKHYLVAWHYSAWIAFVHAASMANLRATIPYAVYLDWNATLVLCMIVSLLPRGELIHMKCVDFLGSTIDYYFCQFPLAVMFSLFVPTSKMQNKKARATHTCLENNSYNLYLYSKVTWVSL
jgi:hypothetical protein